jgi:hypothetical protein
LKKSAYLINRCSFNDVLVIPDAEIIKHPIKKRKISITATEYFVTQEEVIQKLETEDKIRKDEVEEKAEKKKVKEAKKKDKEQDKLRKQVVKDLIKSGSVKVCAFKKNCSLNKKPPCRCNGLCNMRCKCPCNRKNVSQQAKPLTESSKPSPESTHSSLKPSQETQETSNSICSNCKQQLESTSDIVKCGDCKLMCYNTSLCIVKGIKKDASYTGCWRCQTKE